MTNEEAIEHIKLILLRDRNNELHFVSHDEEIALDLANRAIRIVNLIERGFEGFDSAMMTREDWEEIKKEVQNEDSN